MPVREYFSLRYAVPGYTLILIVVAINQTPLFVLLRSTEGTEITGAFLAFLSLLGGSAIGFLVSQVWWWIHKLRGGIFSINEFKGALDVFIQKFGFTPPRGNSKLITDSKMRINAAFDYFSYLEEKQQGKLLALANSRWDMFQLLSSTFHTVWIGVLLGGLLRIYFQLFPLTSLPPSSPFAEPLATLAVLITLSFLDYIIFEEKRWVIKEYAIITEGRIRSSAIEKQTLREAFPDAFADP